MARFRRKAARRTYAATKSRGRSRGKSSSGLTPMNVILASALYGVARPYLANIIPDFVSIGPVTSDNIVIGAASYYGMTKTSGFMKALSTVSLASETAIVASKAMGQVTGPTVTGSTGFVYK